MAHKGIYGPKCITACWNLETRKKALELAQIMPKEKVAFIIGCHPRTIWRWIHDYKTKRYTIHIGRIK